MKLKRLESILLSRKAKEPEYSNLMAEPTRQLLYALTDAVEKKVNKEFAELGKEDIPAPYASYEKQKYFTPNPEVSIKNDGLSIHTSYPSFYMDFKIAIVETDDSIYTRLNSYSIPRTFTLYISSGRNKGMELDIMDFDRNDMNEIASLIAKEAVEKYRNELEKSGLDKKKAITARSMADAIQFDFDNNRRKSRGRAVRRDTTDDDFAFLEIPSVGDLMIQDLGNELKFTLYKHGYKKELKSFSMPKSRLGGRAYSSEQAEPVLDILLGEE